MDTATKPTVIVGGGFTGLFTALYLSHLRYNQPIVLIDQDARFVFKPLLYEFLVGEMSPEQVWPSYDELLAGSGTTFISDTVTRIDLPAKKVELASGLHYDYRYLVLALGSVAGYFGIAGAEENAFSFRTAREAIALQTHLRQQLQKASQTDDPKLRASLLSVAVIGAGPSGLELGLTLADWLPQLYKELGGRGEEVRITLLNRGTEILAGDANTHLRNSALEAMQRRAVPVALVSGAAVSAVRPGEVEYKKDGETAVLEAGTIIWTAGTANHPLLKDLAIPDEQRDKHGKPFVTPTLHLLAYPEVFAGGDCVTLHKSEPAMAQVAYQQAKSIAHNLVNVLAGDVPNPEHVFLRGTLMKLGLSEAAAEIFNKYEIKGHLGHAIRQLTYLEMLPTPVHDLKVTTEWLSDEVFRRAGSLS